MTDLQFQDWLNNDASIRIVLIEATVNTGGNDVVRYLSSGAYANGAADTPANTAYQPLVCGGIPFTEQINLDNAASLSFGDIELYNPDGVIDAWLDDVWVNRPVKAWVGDARWERSEFRLIFDGVLADIDSKSRDKLNLKLRDKLQRLNTPLTDVRLGGVATNADAVVPLCFGEVHNITPVLTDASVLEYQFHAGLCERLIEVRDNGTPVPITVDLTLGKFRLNANAAGTVTASVQGDKFGGTYINTVPALIKRLVTGFGKASDRFTTSDIDTANFAAFAAAHPQPVGLYATDRVNVLVACQQLASSIGAQLVMSKEGLLRLVKVSFPAVGTPTEIRPHQFVERSLKVASRSTPVGAVKLGYCKNWTVQDGLLTDLPAEHKELYAMEWLTASAQDAATQSLYKLSAEPVQQDTLLLTDADAINEASRRLAIFKVPRVTYQFQGTASLMLLQLGQAATLYSSRFGLAAGKTGMVTSLAPDWITGLVNVGVTV
jgi:hypothetical protein